MTDLVLGNTALQTVVHALGSVSMALPPMIAGAGEPTAKIADVLCDVPGIPVKELLEGHWFATDDLGHKWRDAEKRFRHPHWKMTVSPGFGSMCLHSTRTRGRKHGGGDRMTAA